MRSMAVGDIPISYTAIPLFSNALIMDVRAVIGAVGVT